MKTMKYLFGIMLLVMISMTASADDQTTEGEQATAAEVVVSISEFTGGTVAIKDKKGQDVIITVTPAKDYQISKTDLEVIAVKDPASATRGNDPSIAIGSALELTLVDEDGEAIVDKDGKAVDDPTDLTKDRYYKFTVPEGLGAWVRKADFQEVDKHVDKGQLNGDVSWEVTRENGSMTLTISGKGKAELTPVKSGETTAPWDTYAADITSLVVEDGIRSLGDDLLKSLTALTTITLKGQKVVGLGKNELPKDVAVDVPGQLYNEYKASKEWGSAAIDSKEGIKMTGVAFGKGNDYDVFVSSKAVLVPSVLLAYTVSAIDGTNVKISEITDGVIPANVPVLLLSKEDDGDDFRTAASKDKGTAKDEGLLKVAGQGGQKVALGEVYLLYNDVFYLSQAGTIPEGGVYLVLPEDEQDSGSNSKAGTRSALVIGGDDGTTGIISHPSPLTSHLSDAWYDLNGRRLNGKPTTKGIYINSGRKVVIR